MKQLPHFGTYVYEAKALRFGPKSISRPAETGAQQPKCCTALKITNEMNRNLNQTSAYCQIHKAVNGRAFIHKPCIQGQNKDALPGVRCNAQHQRFLDAWLSDIFCQKAGWRGTRMVCHPLECFSSVMVQGNREMLC